MNEPQTMEDLDWKLWIEIMEDYTVTAELGHIAKDQKAHKDEMRDKFNTLVSFIKSEQSRLLQEVLEKMRYEKGVYQSSYVIPLEDIESIAQRWGIDLIDNK